jgi:hypothetical protein
MTMVMKLLGSPNPSRRSPSLPQSSAGNMNAGSGSGSDTYAIRNGQDATLAVAVASDSNISPPRTPTGVQAGQDLNVTHRSKLASTCAKDLDALKVQLDEAKRRIGSSHIRGAQRAVVLDGLLQDAEKIVQTAHGDPDAFLQIKPELLSLTVAIMKFSTEMGWGERRDVTGRALDFCMHLDADSRSEALAQAESELKRVYLLHQSGENPEVFHKVIGCLSGAKGEPARKALQALSDGIRFVRLAVLPKNIELDIVPDKTALKQLELDQSAVLLMRDQACPKPSSADAPRQANRDKDGELPIDIDIRRIG